MKRHAIIIGTKNFSEQIKSLGIIEYFKNQGYEVDDSKLEKKNLFTIRIVRKEEYDTEKVNVFIIKSMFGSGVHGIPEFKNCKDMFLLGMCYGFKGVKPKDYLLPDKFVAVKESDPTYSVTKKIKDLPLTDEIPINNILKPVIEELEPELKKRKRKLHKDVKIITNSFGIFTPKNVKGLKDIKGGEMEAYYVARLAKKYDVPFGCVLICTDNKKHDLSEELINRLKIMVKITDDNINLKELSKDELVHNYGKFKGVIERNPELLEEYKKKLKEIKSKNSPMFKQAMIDILLRILPRLINHLST